MKGLLLKDWYLTIKYARTFIIVTTVFQIAAAFGVMTDFFRIYPTILFSLLPVTIYSYDDREKWNIYTQTMPVSRAQYVTGKYLYGLICLGANLALSALLYRIGGQHDFMDTLLTASVTGLLASALMMPLLFHFGAEKGRVFYLVLIGILFGGAAVLSGSENMPKEIPLPALARWAVCLCIVGVYALSWRISIALYQNREL